jgi:hypothetical protein
MSGLARIATSLSAGSAVIAVAVITMAELASAQDDARTRQLRLLCAQLSGDLTDPGGMAAFRRCMTRDPLDEIRRNNNIAAEPADRPNAAPPAGYGRNSRQSVGDGVNRFLAAEGLLYALANDARLWRRTMGTADGRVVDQDVAAFQVVDAHLFVQGTNGTLWRAKLDGSEKTRIDQAVAAFQPINAGLIYVLGTDRKLWREIGDAGKRIEVDHGVTDFQAIDASLVYVLDVDGQLWREVGTMQSRTLVASQTVAFQYIPEGDTTYVQTSDATLWRKGATEKPEMVDKSVAAFQAVDMHVAYVLGKDGRLWQELAGRDQAVLVDRDVLVTSGKAAFQATDPSHIYILDSDHRLWAESIPAGR